MSPTVFAKQRITLQRRHCSKNAFAGTDDQNGLSYCFVAFVVEEHSYPMDKQRDVVFNFNSALRLSHTFQVFAQTLC